MRQEAFLIPINAITEEQISEIDEYIKNTKWEFRIFKKCIYGFHIYEDCGELNKFFENLNLNKKYIYWDWENLDLDLDSLNREILQHQRKEKLEKLKI